LTYCVLNSRWEYIKDENWEYLIWDFNLINSKWEFVKKEDCEFKDSSKIYKYEQLIWTFLPDFSHWEQNIVEWKKKFQEDESWYFFNLDQNAKFYLAEWGYKIVNKNWEEINYFDKNWNKVYDYYLIFQSEIYKRYILNKTWSITLSEVQKFRWWYISNIIKVLNNWILKYNGVLILENLWKQLENKESNKENILQKTFWITIYQEIETLLNRKYNYFVEKRELSKFQLTPKVKNVWDIKLTEKENININLWNLVFIDEFLTSKECPNCWAWLHRNKKWWDNIYHDENNPWKNWCDFDTREKSKNYWFDFIKSWDDLAAYNIAKRWIEYLKNPTRIVLKDEKKTEKYSDNSHPKLSSNENPMAMDTPFKDLKF
jgi:hypothetical protein